MLMITVVIMVMMMMMLTTSIACLLRDAPHAHCSLGKNVLSLAVEGLHGEAHSDENSRQQRTSDAKLLRQHGAHWMQTHVLTPPSYTTASLTPLAVAEAEG